jgi:flagellar biosynthesis/type III secretory pathway protein FliH
MNINDRAASEVLHLLIGEQGCQLFTALYTMVDNAERRGFDEGAQDGYEDGFSEGYSQREEVDFRDGWNAGWAARSAAEDVLDDKPVITTSFAFDDDLYLLADDFDDE